MTIPAKAITLTATYKDGTNIKTNSLTATDYRMVSLHARHNRRPLLLRIHIRHYPNFYLWVLRLSLPMHSLHRSALLLPGRGNSGHMLHIPYMQMAVWVQHVLFLRQKLHVGRPAYSVGSWCTCPDDTGAYSQDKNQTFRSPSWTRLPPVELRL